MMKYALILVAAIALAPTSALAATNGTVRMDLFDDVSSQNTGDIYSIGGQAVTRSTGFFLFDIDNSVILDAELNIMTNSKTPAWTFDETDFGFETIGSSIKFGLRNTTRAERTFDSTPDGSGFLSEGLSSIDFPSESGRYSIRVISDAGFSPSFHFYESNPGLIFTPAVVPEPSTAMLLGLASMGFFGTRRRRS